MRYIVIGDDGNWLHINGEASIQKIEDDVFEALEDDGLPIDVVEEELPGTECARISVVYADAETDSLELIVVGDVSYLGRLTPQGQVRLYGLGRVRRHGFGAVLLDRGQSVLSVCDLDRARVGRDAQRH